MALLMVGVVLYTADWPAPVVDTPNTPVSLLTWMYAQNVLVRTCVMKGGCVVNSKRGHVLLACICVRTSVRRQPVLCHHDALPVRRGCVAR